MRCGLTVWYKKLTMTTTTTTTTYKAAVCCRHVLLHSHSHPVAAVLSSVCSPSWPGTTIWLRVWCRVDCGKVFRVFFFFLSSSSLFARSVCRPPCQGSHFPLIAGTGLQGTWKALIVQRAEQCTFSHARNRSISLFFKSNTTRQALRSSFFVIRYDNYIHTVHNVTLRKTMSRGSQKRDAATEVGFERVILHSSQAVAEGTEGKPWLLLAFLVSRRRPFSSTKINIWALVAPLCLIRGHPGLHIQKFIDPQNFIQSNSRPRAASASLITAISDTDVEIAFTTICKLILPQEEVKIVMTEQCAVHDTTSYSQDTLYVF